MNNYEYLVQVCEALPSQNTKEDLAWLRAKVEPRLDPLSGWLDLGDGVVMYLMTNGVKVENPDLPERGIGVARVTEITGPVDDLPYRRGLVGHGFNSMAIYNSGRHGYGGTTADLKYHLLNYLKTCPPVRIALAQAKEQAKALQSELRDAKSALGEAQARQRNWEEYTNRSEADVKFAHETMQEAVNRLLRTKRWIKSRELRDIRYLLEACIR